MRRSPTFSTDRRGTLRTTVLFAAIAGACASEPFAYRWGQFGLWIPDLVAGLVFIVGGWRTSTRRGAPALMIGVGLAWFAANVVPDLRYLHRALLIHLLVAFPGVRPRTRLGWAVTSVGYVGVVATPIWNNPWSTFISAVLLVAAIGWERSATKGVRRRAVTTSFIAGVGWSASLVGRGVARLVLGAYRAAGSLEVIYDASVTVVAALLIWRLRRMQRVVGVDLVVELESARSGTLRDALSALLDDPMLQVGYWNGVDSYVDAEGHGIGLPATDDTRVVTFVGSPSSPVAAIIHDRAVLDSSRLVESAAAAARLSAANEALQSVVRDQLADLKGSRLRLLAAADAERARLDRRLEAHAERHLAEIGELLWAGPEDSAEVVQQLDGVREQLDHARRELHELARGLHPRELDRGLALAVESLAERLPVEVSIRVDEVELPDELTSAIFYICSEGLANVVKHAGASSAHVDVRRVGQLVVVEVTDDGQGGAEGRRGSGLVGLADRAAAFGGDCSVISPTGGGTRLLVSMPIAASRSSGLLESRTGHDATFPSNSDDRFHHFDGRSQ